MAYIRTEYTDKHGRTGENVYTHIESYTVNVTKQTTRVKLVTYISEKAKDTNRIPIGIERWNAEGADYENMFGSESVTTQTTRNSDILKVIYEKLNTTPKWGAESVKSTFEKIIKDVGGLKVGDEISRKIAVEKELKEDVDFEVVKEKVVVELTEIAFLEYNKESSSVDFEESLPDGSSINGIGIGFVFNEFQTLTLTTDDYTLNDGYTTIAITNEEYKDILNSEITVEIVFTGTYIPA